MLPAPEQFHTSVASARVAAAEQDMFSSSVERGRDQLTHTISRCGKRVASIPGHKTQARSRGHLDNGRLGSISSKEAKVRFDQVADRTDDMNVVESPSCGGNESFGETFTSVDERCFNHRCVRHDATDACCDAVCCSVRVERFFESGGTD